jgi:diphthamide biosynthesis protein 3
MSTSYDEVDLLDMDLDQEEEVFRYPCPCGDKFFITIEDLLDNEDKATCPSCSLILKIEYDSDKLEKRLEILEAEQPVAETGEEVKGPQASSPSQS